MPPHVSSRCSTGWGDGRTDSRVNLLVEIDRPGQLDQLRIARAIDFTHTASAELSQHFVRAYAHPGFKRVCGATGGTSNALAALACARSRASTSARNSGRPAQRTARNAARSAGARERAS